MQKARCGKMLRGGPCVCVKDHTGLCGNAAQAREACAVAAAYWYLATGQYVQYVLEGDS